MTPTHERFGPRKRLAMGVVAAALVAVGPSGCSGSASSPDPQGSATASRVVVSPGTPEAEALGAAVDTFFERSYAAGKGNVRAVLVSIGGQPVVDRYYRGSGPTDTANVASVTKIVVSTLVGIALADGTLTSLDQTLGELLPAYASDMAPGVAVITLEQLLTMTAGLPPDTSRGLDPSVGGADWVRSILARGTVQPPGEGFAYASGGSHLLAAVLVQATGRPLLEYAREKLFDPLGIDTTAAAQPTANDDPAGLAEYDAASFAWPVDPQGVHVGFGHLKISAPDMAKLGTLYLDGGVWDGRRVVPADWVRTATSPLVPTGLGTPGEDYGYQWWITSADDHPAFAAIGYGGQIIEVVPDLRLVVVASTVISDTATLDAATFELLTSIVIVPALT